MTDVLSSLVSSPKGHSSFHASIAEQPSDNTIFF